jgi:glycerophosphoryl diester phosphodiesterase
MGTRGIQLFAKVREVSDGTTYSFTPSGVVARRGVLLALGGAKTVTDLIVGSLGLRSVNGTPLTNVAPAVTTTAANSVVLTISAEATTVDDTISPSVTAGGASEWFWSDDTDTLEQFYVAYLNVASPGTTSNVTITYQNSQTSNGAALQIIIPEVAAATWPIELYNGAPAVNASLSVWDGAQEAVPYNVGVTQEGYNSVADMLSHNPFYNAHRGGSANWSEMTMRAYTNAVAWGAGALDIALNRTIDGVWFGLHDQTLDRTSGTSGADPTTMTWAQVQAYLCFGEPYLRFEDLMAAYGSTHVFFVDPKYQQSSHRTEFFDLMDTYLGTGRCIIKYSGSNTSLAIAAEARGYERWGYYYEADYTSGDLASTQSAWTILGMSYYASAAAWTAVTGYSKPVIGHIVESTSDAATALGYGAVGLVVSGVKAIIPGPIVAVTT